MATTTIRTISRALPDYETLVMEYDTASRVFTAEIIGADGNVMDELDADGFAQLFGTANLVKALQRLSA